MVVGGGVDEHPIDASPPHPAERIDDEEACETESTALRVDREPLEVAPVARSSAHGERNHPPVDTNAPRACRRRGVDDVAERGAIVRPGLGERPPIDLGGLVELVTAHAGERPRRRPRSGRRMLPAGEVELHEAERVDHVEAGRCEGGHRWREQRPGADRARSTAASLGDPAFDVVLVGDHVMVDQHEMGDV